MKRKQKVGFHKKRFMIKGNRVFIYMATCVRCGEEFFPGQSRAGKCTSCIGKLYDYNPNWAKKNHDTDAL